MVLHELVYFSSSKILFFQTYFHNFSQYPVNVCQVYVFFSLARVTFMLSSPRDTHCSVQYVLDPVEARKSPWCAPGLRQRRETETSTVVSCHYMENSAQTFLFPVLENKIEIHICYCQPRFSA